MPKVILLDESVPAGLIRLLPEFDVRTVSSMGWAGITNGRLLDEVERGGFDILVTADSSIKAQQRLAGRRIALVVLTTNHWVTIKSDPARIAAACATAAPGDYLVVQFPKIRSRRRSSPRPDL